MITETATGERPPHGVHFFVDCRASGWQEQVAMVLNTFKPMPESICCGVSDRHSLHVYYVPGAFSGTYEVKPVSAAQQDDTICTMIAWRTGKLLGWVGTACFALIWV
jgi:hypothetical protein